MASMILYPVKDTTISSFDPGENYGSDYNWFHDFPYYVARCFVGFDISSAPSPDDVTSVSLYMFVRRSARRHNTSGFIRRITGAWAEGEATWNNSSNIATGDTVLSRTFKYSKVDPIWDSQDVTVLYKEAKSLGNTFDIEIRTEEKQSKNGYYGNRFDSREARVYTDQEPYELQKPYLLIEYAEPPALAFADVAISRRWGDKLYLSGRLEHITTSDEICIMYMRPGSTDRLNLKGDDSDYTYFKNVDGSFIFENHAKYLDFNASGHYILEAWDVTDDCETRSQKRCDWFLKVTQPKYQYQLYFDPADPALGDNAYLLQEQIDLYNAYKPYGIIRKDPDCFSGMLGDNQPSPRQSASGWLCQAAEFLSSGCSPFPWWMCRDLTEWDIYMRGECSCDAFQEGLKDLGIPCHHLIAMHEAYGAKPPYCPYIQCP